MEKGGGGVGDEWVGGVSGFGVGGLGGFVSGLGAVWACAAWACAAWGFSKNMFCDIIGCMSG